MAAPVRIEAMAFTDPRVRKLGRLCDQTEFWALGALAYVWSYCTEFETYIVQPDLLDEITEHQGFAERLVESHLGELSEKGIRVCGAEGRIEWWANLRRGRADGGRARAENAMRAGGRFATTSCPPAATSLPEPAQPAVPSPSPSPSPEDQKQCGAKAPQGVLLIHEKTTEEPPEDTKAKARQRELNARVAAEADLYVEWFNRIFARNFTASAEVRGLVKALIVSKRATQKQMRMVSLVCKRKWEDRTEMRAYLVPSSLLRASKFLERLDEAQEMFPGAEAEAEHG